MATLPKIKPCPECGGEYLSVYSYDSGWRYVECDSNPVCWYRGPGEGSIRQAIKSHNEKVTAKPEAAA